jgi:hypothetical protein
MTDITMLSRRSSRSTTKSSRRTRSLSVDARPVELVAERVPALSIHKGIDVATSVSKEVTKGILINPSVDTGVFFGTLNYSTRDLCKSDTTIIISAAILEHIGNKRMSDEVLSRSKTCKKYYESLGLKDALVRKTFVTMLFCLNPLFAAMIRTALRTVIDRTEDLRETDYPSEKLLQVASLLHNEGLVTADEVESAVGDLSELRSVRALAISKGPISPVSAISPSDSVSLLATPTVRRRTISDKDLMTHLLRRRQGTEPDFTTVFPSATPPVSNRRRVPRSGLGYVPATPRGNSITSAMNAILGQHTVPTANIATGSVYRRRPTVEDYNGLEDANVSVYETHESDNPIDWSSMPLSQYNRPLPTETWLPNSVIVDEPRPHHPLVTKTSLELLRERMAGTDINCNCD